MRIVLQPRTVSWALLLGTLAVFAPIRIGAFLGDALDPNDPLPAGLVAAGVAIIAVLFALHLAIAFPRSSLLTVRRVVVAQAVLTFLPYLVLGQSWGPIAGLLAGSTLLTMEPSRGWPVFAVVVTFDAALRTWGPRGIARAGQLTPAELTQTDVSSVEPWLAFASRSLAILTFGLLLFGLTRLAQLTQDVHVAREELAALEVARYRRQAASGLRVAVGDHLDSIVEASRRAVRESAERQRASLRDIAAHARQAMTAVRLVADAPAPDLGVSRSGQADLAVDAGSRTGSLTPPGVTPGTDGVSRLAERVLVLTIAAYSLSFVVNLAGSEATDPWEWIVGAASAALVALLSLRHLRPERGATTARFVLATLLLQLLVTFGWLFFVGFQAAPLVSLSAGAVLVRTRMPWSILGLVIGLAALPIALPDPLESVGWHLYLTAVLITSAVALYALHRIPSIARHLRSTRRDAARVAVAVDRSRVGRDVHDLLGFGLSAISLRAEILARRPDRELEGANNAFEELATLAENALDDLRSLAIDEAELDLARELLGASALLESAGVATRHRIDDARLPPSIDALFAVAVREAVTNVLRHADASAVDIVISAARQEASLTIRNDGVRPSSRDGAARQPVRNGRGIANLTARTKAMHGRLTSGEDPRAAGYELAICVPITSPLAAAHPGRAAATRRRDGDRSGWPRPHVGQVARRRNA